MYVYFGEIFFKYQDKYSHNNNNKEETTMSTKDYEDMSASEKKKEDWMNSKWRPMMGWMYMLVCVADFVAFPVLWSLVQAVHGGSVQTQWSPITLQGAGLFHMAMGAILGIAAFGRTQEKIAGANNGGLSVSTPTPTTAPVTSFSAPTSAPSTSFSAPASSGSFSSGGIAAGKPRPAEPEHPVI